MKRIERICLSPEDAITELAVSMIDLAKEDYIKGALILIKRFAKPMELVVDDPRAKMIIEKSRPGSKSGAERRIYWYKDSLRFIKDDPYGMFQEPEEVIKTWNDEAWRVYHNKIS